MERYWNPANAREHGEYTWCATCQRANRTSAWDNGIWTCPNCGAISRDARPWEDVRTVNPAYPETPEIHQLYTWASD